MRNVLNTVKSRSWCYLILELAVLSSFFGFTIIPGSLGDLMHICGGIFLLNVIAGNYRLKNLTVGHFFALAVFSIILLINLFMPDEMIHRRSVRYFLASPWLIFAIHCLYVNRDKIISRLPKEIYSSAVLFAVLFQFIAYHFDIKNESWGNYSNPHHLGNFVSMTIPLLFYFLADRQFGCLILCKFYVSGQEYSTAINESLCDI